MGAIFSPTSSLAGGRIIQEDSNNDGKTDRIVHLAPSGDVIELEADTNGDQKMDTFQYYHRGVVERIERDTNGDGRMDTVYQYEARKPLADVAPSMELKGLVEVLLQKQESEQTA